LPQRVLLPLHPTASHHQLTISARSGAVANTPHTVDRRPSTIPQRLWVRGARSRPAHPGFFPKSWKGFFRKTGDERKFSNARPFANPSPGTLRRHALGVVRGDEPDCPGKRNLLTALIGLQRAADRPGNRGTRFRALVLQDTACGSKRHRGLEGLFDPASTGNV